MIALQGQGPMSPMFLIVMVVFIVFFMVIPGIKKQRAEKKFKASLQKGLKVVTMGGIHGKIADMDDDTVTVETSAGKLVIERSALSMELTNKYNK